METKNVIYIILIMLFCSLTIKAQGFQTVEETDDNEGLTLLREAKELCPLEDVETINEGQWYDNYVQAKEILGVNHLEILYFEAMCLKGYNDKYAFQKGYADLVNFWHKASSFIEKSKKSDIRRVQVTTLINKHLLVENLANYENGNPKTVQITYRFIEDGSDAYAKSAVLFLNKNFEVTKRIDKDYISFESPLKEFYENNKEVFFIASLGDNTKKRSDLFREIEPLRYSKSNQDKCEEKLEQLSPYLHDSEIDTFYLNTFEKRYCNMEKVNHIDKKDFITHTGLWFNGNKFLELCPENDPRKKEIMNVLDDNVYASTIENYPSGKPKKIVVCNYDYKYKTLIKNKFEYSLVELDENGAISNNSYLASVLVKENNNLSLKDFYESFINYNPE